MTDTNKLKELAERATPGPWTLYVPENYQGPEELPGYGVECAEGRAIIWGALEPETGCQFDRDAEFIAAANPQAILGLLERLEKAEQHWANENSNNMALIAEVERLNEELSACTEHPGGCGYWREAAKLREAERDKIQAEVERFKDANREISETNTRRRYENVRLKAENEALRKQLEQVHPFKFAGQHEGHDLKCAACGGYHYGLPPNMPCPKSAAIAQDAAALEGGGK